MFERNSGFFGKGQVITPRLGPAGGLFSILLVFVLTFLFLSAPNARHNHRHSKMKSCFANQRVLSGAVELWNMDHSAVGSPTGTLQPMTTLQEKELIRENYLRNSPSCRDGGRYIGNNLLLDPTVSCNFHGFFGDEKKSSWEDCQKNLESMESKVSGEPSLPITNPGSELRALLNLTSGPIPYLCKGDKKVPWVGEYGVLKSEKGVAVFCSLHGILEWKINASDWTWKRFKGHFIALGLVLVFGILIFFGW